MVFSVLWCVGGFDSSMFSIIAREQYGNGTHISTLLNVTVIFYLVYMNVGENGLSFQGFKTEVKRDLRLIYLTYIHRNKFLKRGHLNSYSKPSMNSFYLLITSIGAGVFAAYVFEIIWAHLFNLGNYGDWNWPLYYLEGSYSSLAFRNYGFMLTGLVLALVWPRIFLGVKIRLRNPFNRDVGFLLIFASILLFATWFYYPFGHHIYTYDEAVISGYEIGADPPPLENTVSLPGQIYFPQTVYALYSLDSSSPTEGAYGFYAPNELIHLLNVVTKVFCTFACAYPFIYAKAYSEMIE